MGFEHNSLREAKTDVDAASAKLSVLIARGAYTINEVKEVRALLLLVVRNQLDPLTGHLPEKRHY
jgi:hypothetical protein